MNKKLRQQVYDKFGGRCAYTGKPLGDNWQVDHVTPKRYWQPKINKGEQNEISNLLPALKIVNHYKRGLDIEGFRKYMAGFHQRLAKLPKNPTVQKSINRIRYMNEVAAGFDITVDKPFSGVFFFEFFETI